MTPADVVRREAPGASFVSPSPLVSREQELAALSGHLEDAFGCRGRLVTIVGTAGVGKSRLVQWTAERASERGALVVAGRCWESADAPAYWPWTQVVRQIFSQLDDAEVLPFVDGSRDVLGRLAPDLRSRLGIDAPQEISRFDEFDSLTLFLKALSETQPLLLVFEDLHAADESTLLMLQFLGREIRDHAILVLATFEESGLRRRPQHARILSDIGRDGARIQVTGLDEAGVAKLYEAIAGEKPIPAIVEALLRASEGNPLFVEEATRMLTAEGDLHRRDYSMGFRVPSGVRDMIRRRVEALSEEAATVLSVAAVIGREFDIEVLERLSGVSRDATLDLLWEAVAADLVEEAGFGTYSFTHILTREALYEDLTAAERMRLHRAAAEAIEDLYSSSLDSRVAELAHHWFKAAQAGDRAKTVDYASRAAREAASVGAHEEALRLFQRALKAASAAQAPAAALAKLRDELQQAREATGTGAAPASGSGASAENDFVLEGDYWTVTYHGTTSRLKNTRGLRLMAHLLRNPGNEVHVLDLVRAVDGGEATSATVSREDGLQVGGDDAGSVLDATAKEAYRQRLRDLQEEVEEAELFNDPERASRAREEMEALAQQLSAALGLGGRDRKTASNAERARVACTKAIKDALRKLSDVDPAIGAHLTSTVKTGTFCSYTPDPRVPITWRVHG